MKKLILPMFSLIIAAAALAPVQAKDIQLAQGRGNSGNSGNQGRGAAPQGPPPAASVAADPEKRKAAAKGLSNYHRAFVASRKFDKGPYKAPPGWTYKKWNYGQILPEVYYETTYWITDYVTYGFDAPPPGFVWVRYGPDAIMVDHYTGEIIEIQFSLFL